MMNKYYHLVNPKYSIYCKNEKVKLSFLKPPPQILHISYLIMNQFLVQSSNIKLDFTV